MTPPTIFDFAHPTDLILESPPITQNPDFSTPASRYQGYLNQLCLNAVLPWLQEYDHRACVPSAALPSFWELVNGTAVAMDGKRFILVPSEAMDCSELRVPQEWVDISSWVGDYYLAVQVESDEGYVKVWGYCTHAQLKTRSSYDAGDRTYSLDASDLIPDINALLVALEFCPEETTRSPTLPIPSLPQAQAENLIARLGSIATPRLAVPWTIWAALLEHAGWRKALYQRRLGLPEQWSILSWLQGGVSQLARQSGWDWRGDLNVATARSAETQSVGVICRQLTIAGQSYELRITQSDEVGIWRFELQSSVGVLIPGGFKLRLLTSDLQPFPNNEDIAITASQQLFLEVALEPGEGLVWEIEPVPENYEREILIF